MRNRARWLTRLKALEDRLLVSEPMEYRFYISPELDPDPDDPEAWRAYLPPPPPKPGDRCYTFTGPHEPPADCGATHTEEGGAPNAQP